MKRDENAELLADLVCCCAREGNSFHSIERGMISCLMSWWDGFKNILVDRACGSVPLPAARRSPDVDSSRDRRL